MSDDTGIEGLIRRASDPASSPESLHKALGPALASLPPHNRPVAEAGLRRLVEEVIDAPTRPDLAGLIALACGALVERGLDPTIAIGPVLDRLERQVLPDAIALVEACREADNDDPPPSVSVGEGASETDEDPDDPDPVARHGERLAALMPTESQSFQAIEPFTLAAVAMLSRSSAARKASWSRTALRALLHALGGQYGYAGTLWVMSQVLDDEPIWILHPGQGKGYLVRTSGLSDNFQLHTLLADALIGRFPGSWLRGERPSRAEVAAARDGPSPPEGLSARGVFNLWTWRALQPDGSPPDLASGHTRWVWNEGVPADIPPFEGRRVVLLGPPPYPRSWNAGRRFPHMHADLRVERILPPAEVRDLLGRIAAAVAAG